jgi:hypothetical protein
MNYDILIDGEMGGSYLKDGLEELRDFIVIPTTLWQLLTQWYGTAKNSQ